MKAASRDQRRDEILDHAVEVLAERGYRDASMLEIAKRAAASKETLYAWFGDKQGLFEAAIRRNARSTLGVNMAGLPQGAAGCKGSGQGVKSQKSWEKCNWQRNVHNCSSSKKILVRDSERRPWCYNLK